MSAQPPFDAVETKDAKEECEVISTTNPLLAKGYRTRHLKSGSGDESEGESESEDANIVWRGLTPLDLHNLKNGKGLQANTQKNDKDLYTEIREHVENGSKPDHKCGLMSATRSKKVAARYSSSKCNSDAPQPSNVMAKIKLDSNIGSVDLTDPNEIQKSGLVGTAMKFAENSQEVIIYTNVQQKNILAIYEVKRLWGVVSKETKEKYDAFIKFRAYEKDVYYSFGVENMRLVSSVTPSTPSTPVALKLSRSLSLEDEQTSPPPSLLLSKGDNGLNLCSKIQSDSLKRRVICF